MGGRRSYTWEEGKTQCEGLSNSSHLLYFEEDNEVRIILDEYFNDENSIIWLFGNMVDGMHFLYLRFSSLLMQIPRNCISMY